MRGGLRLNISPEQGDQYKLVWGCNSGELRAYCVSGEKVRRASEEVRAILDEISQHYKSCEITGAKYDYSTSLPDLAFAGERLGEALFTPISGNEASATQARTYISEQIQEGIPLTIFISGTPLYVPWAFVYRADPTNLQPCALEPSDFSDFWTNLFNISISFSRTTLFAEHKINQTGEFNLVHALHRKHFSNAVSLLSADEQKLIDELINHEIGKFTDWHSCRKKWRECKDVNSIIYVFGHSDGKTISLADDTDDPQYMIDSNGFSASFRKQGNSSSNTICFINGCRSGAGYLGDGFLTVTAMHGFQGFIGSEAELSSTFAARYGAEFMRCLCAGRSVEEAFSLLRERREFFPLNLFYSCYAEPDFHLV